MSTLKDIELEINNFFIDLVFQESNIKNSNNGYPKRCVALFHDKKSTPIKIIVQNSQVEESIFENRYFKVKLDKSVIIRSLTPIQNNDFILCFDGSIPLDQIFLQISEDDFQKTTTSLDQLILLLHPQTITLNLLSPVKMVTVRGLQGTYPIYRIEVSDLSNYETTLYCKNNPIIEQISSLYSQNINQITFSNLQISHFVFHQDCFLSKKLRVNILKTTSILSSNSIQIIKE